MFQTGRPWACNHFKPPHRVRPHCNFFERLLGAALRRGHLAPHGLHAAAARLSLLAPGARSRRTPQDWSYQRSAWVVRAVCVCCFSASGVFGTWPWDTLHWMVLKCRQTENKNTAYLLCFFFHRGCRVLGKQLDVIKCR